VLAAPTGNLGLAVGHDRPDGRDVRSIPQGFLSPAGHGPDSGADGRRAEYFLRRAMQSKKQIEDIVLQDPAVAHTGMYTGRSRRRQLINSGACDRIEPWAERDVGRSVIDRMRPKLARSKHAGVSAVRAGHSGWRASIAHPVPIHPADQDIEELTHWSNVMLQKLQAMPQLQDVTTDLQNAGSRTMVKSPRNRLAPRRPAAADRRHAL